MELYECHICGTKSYTEDDLDECSSCHEIVCIECSGIIDGQTVCSKCQEQNYEEDEVITEKEFKKLLEGYNYTI